MVFSSITFLFLFLPLVLAAYYVLLLPVFLGARSSIWWWLSNTLLLAVSLVFYFWGESFLVWIVIASTGIDYFCGLLISGGLYNKAMPTLEPGGSRSRLQRFGLVLSICSNLMFLGYFKYFNFGVDSLSSFLSGLGLTSLQWTEIARISLPLGISFYTFQSMSYTIDVYRGRVRATRNFLDFACYVTLFPQLVAGPIVRYRDLADQLRSRSIHLSKVSDGVCRFVLGLGKKVIVANTVAIASDKIFALPTSELTTGLAWLAVVCYTIQIYFDFSGYSDMAIGLGQMLGFDFPENFNYPYIARTVQDFWRRWHISLSSWFRDYVYFPLGGNRKSDVRTYFNLLTVFFLCGLWHGASWTFVVWGLYHGFFLVLERLATPRRLLSKSPAAVGHCYTLLVVMGGWVLFRSETFSQATAFLSAMCGFAPGSGIVHSVGAYLREDVLIALILGVVFSAPVSRVLVRTWKKFQAGTHGPFGMAANVGMSVVWIVGLFALLGICAMSLAADTHNPFIYYRF